MNDEELSLLESITQWLGSSGLKIALIVLVVYVVRKFGNLVVERAIKRTIKSDSFATPTDEKKREETLVSITTAALRVALWVVAGMLIVQEFGIDIGPLIAGASVIGVALGFGAQSLVKDFVSGLFIILENQYRVGDVVTIAGVSGSVEAISVRETVLRDLDGNVHHVPNGSIDVATNKTMDFSRINLNIGVGYDTKIDKVEKIIDEVGVEMMSDEEWSDNIIEAPRFVRVNNFGPNEIELKILGKVKPGSQWSVAGEFRRRIKLAFDKNKIEIPFPQTVVHQAKN